MPKISCNLKRANESNHVTPSICHALVFDVQYYQAENYMEIEWLVVASSDPNNVKKKIKRRYYATYQDKPSAAFDKALKAISIATGALTENYFKQCEKAKTDPDIELDDWLGRQCVISVAAQKGKPQYSQVEAVYSVDADEAAGCPFNEEIKAEVKKDPQFAFELFQTMDEEENF